MYKVMIVEDEMLVRTGIRASIQWEKFNMYVIGEASNGQTAWELYQKNTPDLVLTDIKMPFMDGIELIRRIRSTGNATQIIILSCLDDFSLAREAIRLGVCGYILKLTMTPEEMEEVLAAAENTLKESALPQSHPIAPADTRNILEYHLLGHLAYNIPELSACLSTLRDYQIPLYSHDLVLALMAFDQYERLQDLYQDSHGLLIQFSILNICNEILSKSNSGLALHESGPRYLLIFHSKEETRSMQHILAVLEEIITVLRNYFNVTPHFYVSEMAQELSRLRPLYRQCFSMARLDFFSAAGNIAYYDASWEDSLRQAILSRTRRSLSVLADPDFCRSFILDPLPGLLFWEPLSEKLLNLFYDAYVFFLHKQRLSQEESSSRVRDFLGRVSACASYYSMLDCFVSSVRTLEELASKSISCSREILSALQFIQNHYAEPLTLHQISDITGLSANYFSSLFKKELGISFLEYLNRHRIEKSMELLLHTSLKTYEIASQCGFSDESYFGKTFKKYTGKTPNEYKKSCCFTPDSK